jgi:hypothetical protein
MPNLIIVDLYIKAPQESLTMPITIDIIIWQFLFYLWHGLVKIVTNRHNRMVKKHPGPCVFNHCFYWGPHLLPMSYLNDFFNLYLHKIIPGKLSRPNFLQSAILFGKDIWHYDESD